MLELRYNLYDKSQDKLNSCLHQTNTFNSSSQAPPTSLEDQYLLVGLISSEKDSSSGLPPSVSNSRSLVLTCTWNPLPSPAPLDGESFNECDTVMSRNSPSQGTLLCW